MSEGSGDHLVVGHCLDERVPAGATLVVTFEEPGDYPITCTYHPGMHTVIHVTPAS